MVARASEARAGGDGVVPPRSAPRGGRKAPKARTPRAAKHASTSRSSRVQESREATAGREVSDKTFMQPTSLDAPSPRPGYRQKWVRVMMNGREDVTNWARKQRQGWLPRHPDTVPKGFAVPRISSGTFSGCIGVEGMILCELAETLAARRDAAVRSRTDAMTQAIDDKLREVNKAAKGSSAFGKIQRKAASVRVREVKSAVDDGEGGAGGEEDAIDV